MLLGFLHGVAYAKNMLRPSTFGGGSILLGFFFCCLPANRTVGGRRDVVMEQVYTLKHAAILGSGAPMTWGV